MPDKKISETTEQQRLEMAAAYLFGYSSFDNFRMSIDSLRKLIAAAFAHKPADEDILLNILGQSNTTGTPAGFTLSAVSAGIRDWSKEAGGVGTHDWRQIVASETIHPTVTPYTGYIRGNTPNIGIECAEVLKEVTGRNVSIVTTHWTGGSITRWSYLQGSGNAGWEHNDQLAAAIAADPTLPNYPDLVIWEQGFADTAMSPIVWAELLLDFKRYAEGPNYWGWADPDNTRWVVVATPEYSVAESHWNGPEIFCALTNNEVGYINVKSLPTWDNVHWDGNELVKIGQMCAMHFLGLRASTVSEGAMRVRRSFVDFDLGVNYAAISDSAGTLTTAWNHNTAKTKIRASYTGLNSEISLGDRFQPNDIVRFSETGNPSNYIDFKITDTGTYDDPNSPNHLEWPCTVSDESNWTAPVAGTACTLEVYYITVLATLNRRKFFDGGEGSVGTIDNVQLDKLAFTSTTLPSTASLRRSSESQVAEVGTNGQFVASGLYKLTWQAQFAGVLGGGDALGAFLMPDGTAINGWFEIDGKRTDGGSDGETYYAKIPFSAEITDSSNIPITVGSTIGECDGSTGTMTASVYNSAGNGSFSGNGIAARVNGIAAQTWDWTVTAYFRVVDEVT